MGSMHTGLEDRARDFPSWPRISLSAPAAAPGCWCRAASHRIAPAGPSPSRASYPAARSGPASAGDRGRACGGRPHLHADPAHRPLCLSPVSRGAVGHSRAHQPVQTARTVDRWRARPDRRLRELRACSRARRVTTASRSWVPRVTSSTSSSCRAPTTRTDEWGGDPREPRTPGAGDRAPDTRAAVGERFIIIFRISGLDLVEGGGTGAEVEWLASQMESAGATMLNTGIGWHEARVPTIAGVVPRGAFGWVSARIKAATRLPVIATNRFNAPEDADALHRQRRRGSHLHGATAARGSRICRARRWKAARTRSTPVSPATRDASTRSSRTSAPPAS